jgi:L-cysteine/cystine lyase
LSWADERARFPVLAEHAYLNAGTFGPLSRETLRAMASLRAWEGEHGRAGGAYFEALIARRTTVRELLATQIRVSPANVALTDSTTQGVHIVVAGLGLGADDEVVTTDAEHFGLTGPLAAAGARLRIASVNGKRAAEIFDAIRELVTPRTRLIAISAVSWIDGTVFPWRELAEATGVPVLVDGAQAAGAIDVDATPADFFTVSAQKWLCGPDGTGALYVRDIAALPPRLIGYPAAESYDIAEGTWVPKAGAARFDPSFTPATSLAGLEAALSNLPAGRLERAYELAQRARELLLESGIEVVTEPGQSTLLSFRVKGDTTESVTRLYEQGVILRELPGMGLLRASVGWWNDEGDLSRLVDAVRA